MRKSFFVGALLIPAALFGTSIFALRTPRWIIIGSDSRAIYRGTPGPSSVCKIFQSGPLYFAIAGLGHDQARNFYPETIVARNLSPTEDFSVTVGKVSVALEGALLKELRAMKIEDAESYRWTMKDGGEMMSILLAEVQNGVPYVAGLGFHFTDSSETQITVKRLSCPGDCPNDRQILYFGKTGAAQQFVQTHPSIDDPVALIRHLVELEIQESPLDVGPPIAILAIDPTGPRWVANETACPVVIPIPVSVGHQHAPNG